MKTFLWILIVVAALLAAKIAFAECWVVVIEGEHIVCCQSPSGNIVCN